MRLASGSLGRVAAMCLLAAAVPAAFAGGSGTLNDTTLTLEYDGGPYVVANPTNVAGEPNCTADVNCDVYVFTVDISEDFRTLYPLASIDVSVTWPSENADFDVYLYDSAGTQITKSEGSFGGFDGMSMPLELMVNGSYEVRTTAFLPLGDSVHGTVAVTGLEQAKSSGVLAGAASLWLLLPLAGFAALRRRA